MNFTFLQGLQYVLNIGLATLLIFDLGYRQKMASQLGIDITYLVLTVSLLSLTLARNQLERPSDKRDRFSLIILALLLIVTILLALREIHEPLQTFFAHAKRLLVAGLLIYIFHTLSKATRLLYSGFINPALLFASSFAIIILLGSLLLTLPMATYEGISFVDALFTATSAVSVTGLAVLDTGKDFTVFGQSVILFLIQLGGLGILTITSFFAFFFRSGNSFREGIYVKEMISSESMGNVLGLAARIVIFTFTVELTGALLIYYSIGPEMDMRLDQRLFFSLFHSISGFCNAGFSPLSNSLYEGSWRFNYSLHWIVAALLIVGGLGFSIVFNFYVYFRAILRRLVSSVREKTPFVLPIRVITLNTKIVLVTTLTLIASGTIFFFFVEYNNTLGEHRSFFGKFSEAFFLAVTPRTAGFNTVNTAALTTPSILITFLLMWIGASPGSTGGGIKTSTFAIATLNILAIARSRPNVVVGSREISRYSIDRAFAILSLSLIVIGFSIFFVSIFEPDLDLLYVAFECFSAYSTVGLSLGITADLTPASKFVLILTMFIGRIGAINILVGMLRDITTVHHQYPTENILIN